jgi:hypothetical protein
LAGIKVAITNHGLHGLHNLPFFRVKMLIISTLIEKGVNHKFSYFLLKKLAYLKTISYLYDSAGQPPLFRATPSLPAANSFIPISFLS